MKNASTAMISICIICVAQFSSAATVDVFIHDFFFTPKTVNITAGDSVRWTNQTSGTIHTSTSGTGCIPDGLWDSGSLTPGQSFTVAFPGPGSYPYFCIPHCAFGMTGTVAVNPDTLMPAPGGQQFFSYSAVNIPFVNNDPALAMPLGVGTVSTGGGLLSLRVAMNAFFAPVDIYFALIAPSDPGNIYLIRSDGSIQPFVNGFLPWKQSQSAGFDESLFGDIPTSLLPGGEYAFFVAVTPAGFINAYYIWQTSLVIVP